MLAPLYYRNAEEWRAAAHKRVVLFGMSGLGKSHNAMMLREKANWYHYSIDYRIGTRYLGEEITEDLKMEAMKRPKLAQLLHSDSIKIASNMRFSNLEILATYLGKPGAEELGGVAIDEYRRRQNAHSAAEKRALLDTGLFIERSQKIYDSAHFICDTSGSLCEIVDADDPHDPILRHLAERCLLIWLKGSEAHSEMLLERFRQNPKPMYYAPTFLDAEWEDYVRAHGDDAARVKPDAFVCALYKKAMPRRQPLYARIAENWGITIAGDDIMGVRDESAFIELVAQALLRRERG